MSLFFRFSVGLLAFLAFTIWGGQAVFAQELTAKEFPLSTRPVVLLSVAAPSPNTWDSNPGRKLTGYLGNRSCAASSCHGNPSRADLLQSAAHFYQDYDPHGKAGVLLYDDRSAEMMARLGISIPAWKFEACLRCHAPGGLSPNLDLGTAIAEGVGCESCHGSASKWVAPHRSEAWNFPAQWSSSAKNAAGFVETKHLPTRAEMCVACHVGSPGQQVTHDLIAAGHPRLTFEFAAYQSLLPFHWRRSDDSRRLANQNQTRDEVSLEAQSWLIGQLVTARAESRLIRESISCETASFPELSQYDCFACHHDLSHPSARQTHRSSRRGLGQMAWGTWGIGLLADMADAPFQPAEFALVLESLREPMRQLSSDRNRIDQTGRELEGIISQWLESLARRPITRSQASAILGHLLSQRGNLVSEGWDQAAHLYLSTVALRPNFRSPMRRGNLGDDDIFQELRDRLSWNRGESDHFAIFDSPRYVSGNAREEIVELFDQINARLSRQRDVPRSASENGSSDSNAGNWVQFTDPAQASF